MKNKVKNNMPAIEQQIEKLIKKHKIDNKLSVSEVKKWVFEADGATPLEAAGSFHQKVLEHFKKVKSAKERKEVMETFQNAWDFWPHKNLGNKSPQQVFLEKLNQEKQAQGKNEMALGDFLQELLVSKEAVLEKLQRHFKYTSKAKILPAYKEYLQGNYSIQTADKHFKVANLLIQKALWAGFIKYEDLRDDFIYGEFVTWWLNSSTVPILDENELIHSIDKFLKFTLDFFGLIPLANSSGRVGEQFVPLDLVAQAIADTEKITFDIKGKKYLIIESYCSLPKCDCRRVMIDVVDSAAKQSKATLHYGWESLEYYEKFTGGKEEAGEIFGLRFAPFSLTGEEAEDIFGKVATLIRNNPKFNETFKRHYSQFKKSLNKPYNNVTI